MDELIKRCQNGDMGAFKDLYENHITRALQTAYLLVNNKYLAEDIVQEAFIECYRDIKYLKNPEAFKSWFYKILLRVSWRMAKKERGYKKEELNADSHISLEAEDKSSAFEAIDLNNVVQKSIENLNSKLQKVIILHYYNDMSVKEISRALGCFEGTVKSRLHTARKTLKKQLEARGFMDSKSNCFVKKECEING